jgi:hypothetical protein
VATQREQVGNLVPLLALRAHKKDEIKAVRIDVLGRSGGSSDISSRSRRRAMMGSP